LMGVSTVTHWS